MRRFLKGGEGEKERRREGEYNRNPRTCQIRFIFDKSFHTSINSSSDDVTISNTGRAEGRTRRLQKGYKGTDMGGFFRGKGIFPKRENKGICENFLITV